MEYDDVEGEQLAMLEVICEVGLTSVGQRGAPFAFCLFMAGVVYYVFFTETPLVFSLAVNNTTVYYLSHRGGALAVYSRCLGASKTQCLFLFAVLRIYGLLDC